MNTTTHTSRIKQDEPAACIVCLSCLNNGRVLGKWITAAEAAAEIEDETAYPYAGQGEPATYPNTETTFTRCRKCGGDEWEMVDHEHTPHSCRNARTFYENAAQLAELHENDQLEIITTLAGCIDVGGYMSLDELVTYHETYYYGEHNTATDFAQDYADNTGDLDAIPEHLRHLIDMEQYAHELMYNYFSENGHYWWSA
jgi:antirestriction protein